MSRSIHRFLAVPLSAALSCAGATALAATPDELLADYTKAGGATPSAERGQKLFTTNFDKSLGLSCSSCHGALPTKASKDAVTEKRIEPLAPAFNDKRFRDKTRVEYMFRMNCKDVVGRECTAGEKADVLAWLISLKP